MTRNVGSFDRGARVFLALVLTVTGFALGGAWAWVLGGAGLVLAATAVLGTCPIYLATGTSTVRRRRRR